MTAQLPSRLRGIVTGLLRCAGALLGTFLFFALLVCVAGEVSWRASGAGKARFAALQSVAAPERQADPRTVVQYRAEEWPTARGRRFHEAPMLAQQVAAGALPPVEQRLPATPLMLTPPERIGPYGGALKRYAPDVNDISTQMVRLSYNALMRWTPMADGILPHIVTRWQQSDGGRVYTIWLRKGIRWSDGQPFTANDILFWYNDVLKNDDLVPIKPPALMHGGEMVRVEKLDDYTVRFHFREPYGLFVESILVGGGGRDMVDYPAHYLKQFHPNYVPKAKLEAQARAKGFTFWYQLFGDRRDWRNPDIPRLWPWVLKSPPPAQPVVFVRNPYYWKVDAQGNQLPYLDYVTFDIFDPETINLRAIQGDIGMQGRHLRFDNYALYMSNRKQGHYRVLHWIDGSAGLNVIGLNLNHRDPAMRAIIGDRRFRIALSYAMNRKELNDVVFYGTGKPRQACPPPLSAFYAPDYEQAYTDYRPDLANKLLDEMGLQRRDSAGLRVRPDGKLLRLFIDATEFGCNARLLELVAEQWTAVGVKTELKLEARQLFYQRKAALMHDLGVWTGEGELVPILDPRWFFPFSGESIQGVDYARWYRSHGEHGAEPPADIRKCMELYAQIECTPDRETQQALFRQIIDLNKRNLWVIGTIGEVPALYLAKDTMRNVPAVALHGMTFHSPGNTAPECWCIVPDAGK